MQLRLLSKGNFKSDLANCKVREKLANVNPPQASVQQRSSDTVSYTPDRLVPEIVFDEDHDLTELLSQEEGQDPETAQDMRRELYGFERV
jgi:hypothetical protein